MGGAAAGGAVSASVPPGAISPPPASGPAPSITASVASSGAGEVVGVSDMWMLHAVLRYRRKADCLSAYPGQPRGKLALRPARGALVWRSLCLRGYNKSAHEL